MVCRAETIEVCKEIRISGCCVVMKSGADYCLRCGELISKSKEEKTS